ncbi:hypothetical protein AB0M10_15205 [Streptomyces sp. NPDC051840]|uniref:hypothetical protein n=1 Tax=Streptomyces sp. NPDC051840 TaxID=3154752 RepID=UPI00344067F1
MSYDMNDSWDRYMCRHDGYDSDSAYAFAGKGYPVCDFMCCLPKPGPDAPACAVIVPDLDKPPLEACRLVATHTLFYSRRDWDTQVRTYLREPVCMPCVRRIRERKDLQVTAYVIGEEPFPLLVGGDAAATPAEDGPYRVYTVFGVQSDASGDRYVAQVFEGEIPTSGLTWDGDDEFTAVRAVVSANSSESAADQFLNMGLEEADE